MQKHPLRIETASAQQSALLLSYGDCEQPRRLVLLHGAGVAGETTWTYLANYLTEWDEILIPDFAGMGNAAFLNNDTPKLDDYAAQINELLQRLDWQQFDIAGYSFGGMITERLLRERHFDGLCFLIEPAMLFSCETNDILQKAQDYAQVAERVLNNPDDTKAYRIFLDSVSPHRLANARAENLTIARLRENALGFAKALQAVSQSLQQEAEYFQAWLAPWVGGSFVGGLTPKAMHERHQGLAAFSLCWRYEAIEGGDHSLVFTRPRAIAAVMNEIAQQR